MKAQCPHCKAENEANLGELRRCDSCNKTYEHGGDSDDLSKQEAIAKQKEEQQAKRAKLAERDREIAKKERVKAQQKECQYCKELIHTQAVVCKHCHCDLDFNERVLKSVENASGMALATFFMIMGYILIAVGILAVFISYTAGASLLGTGFSSVLLSHVVKSTIRTAEYTKIIASKRR